MFFLPWEACLPLVSTESATTSTTPTCSAASWNKTEKLKIRNHHHFFQCFPRATTSILESEQLSTWWLCYRGLIPLQNQEWYISKINFQHPLQTISSSQVFFGGKHLSCENSSDKGSVHMVKVPMLSNMGRLQVEKGSKAGRQHDSPLGQLLCSTVYSAPSPILK